MNTRFVRVVDFSPVVLRWVIMTNRDSVTFTLSVIVLHYIGVINAQGPDFQKILGQT